MEAERRKHLEFLQSIITRMNTNSFQIKGWSVTIVSALLALYASTKELDLILLGMLPALVFWLLDAYYLTQERKYVGLYNDVAGVPEQKTTVKLFSMNTSAYEGGRYAYWGVLWSQTIWTLYLPLIFLLAGLWGYVRLN